MGQNFYSKSHMNFMIFTKSNQTVHTVTIFTKQIHHFNYARKGMSEGSNKDYTPMRGVCC